MTAATHSITAERDELIDSEAYRAHQTGLKPAYPEELDAAARADILVLLQSRETLYLTTLTPEGWPVGDSVPFRMTTAENDRPVFEIRLSRSSAAFANIAANPRVAVLAYQALGFEQRRQTRSVQIQAFATVLQGEEADAALAGLSERPQPPRQTPEAEDAAAVRIDALLVDYHNNSWRNRRGTIDYGPDVRLGER